MDKNKKIILLDQYNSIGGGQNILLRIAKILYSEYNIVYWGPIEGDLFKRMIGIGKIKYLSGIAWDKVDVRTQYFRYMLKSFINTIKIAFKLFNDKNLRPNIIFANGGKVYHQAIILGMVFRVPVVLGIHLIYNSYLMPKFLSFCVMYLRNVNLLFVSNSVLYKFMQDNNLFNVDKYSNKIQVIENSLSEKESNLEFDYKRFSFFEQKKNPLLKVLELNVAVVGRIHQEKGHDFLFDIIDETFAKNWHFFIIGSYSFGGGQFAEILQNRMSDRVTFYGEVDDVPKALKELQIHIVIMPSRVAESFGLIAIEAMAASCLTIVSDSGELPNIAKKTGALVFHDRKDFRKLIENIAEFGIDNAAAMVKDMQQNTVNIFQFLEYRNRIINYFNEICIMLKK